MSKQTPRPGRFGIGTLLKLPATLNTIRSFWSAINWNEAEADVRDHMKKRIVITGMANTGKSTLFNMIQGKVLSSVSSVAGSTKAPIEGTFGPFVLIDTPGHLPDVQESTAKDSSVIVMLLDATTGLTQDDVQLFMRLKDVQKPIVLALNKVDAVRVDAEKMAAEFARKLGVTDIIPISARLGTNVAEDLIPAIIEASPDAALIIGRYLPDYRRKSAQKLIRNAALVSMAAGLEPIPLIDIPIILGNQVRLVLQLASLYGEPVGVEHIRELMGTIIGGLAGRYLAEEVAKMVPFGGDLVSGAIAAASTWAIGQTFLSYFEHGIKMNRGQMRKTFKSFYQTFRAIPDPKKAVDMLPPPQIP